MARPVETRLAISCLRCDWSVETTNTSAEVTTACTLPTGPLAHSQYETEFASPAQLLSRQARGEVIFDQPRMAQYLLGSNHTT